MTRPRVKLIATAVVAGIALAGGLWAYYVNQRPADTPGKGEQFSNPVTKDIKTGDTNQDNLNEPKDPEPVSSPGITVSAPKAGSALSDGSTVSGTAQADDGKLYVLIKGEESGVVADYAISIKAGSTNQPFSFKVAFSRPVQDEPGTLELYTLKAGRKNHITDVKVTLR